MSDLIEASHVVFPPVLSSHLAARMGESVNGMRRALKAAVPVMLGGIMTRSASNAEQNFALCQQAYQARHIHQVGVTCILAMLGSKDASDSAMMQGSRLLAAFGSAEQAIITGLGQYARIQPMVAKEVLELVGAVLLETMGRHCAHHQLDAEKMAAVLANLRNKVQALLPRELVNLVELSKPRTQSRWKQSAIFTSDTIMQQILGLRVSAQWYLIASVVLIITGVWVVAVGALQAPPTAQLPAQTDAAQAVETVSAVAEKDAAPLRIIY
jgi:hypothetical protein